MCALSSRALERAVQIQEVTLRAASGEDPVDASGQDFWGRCQRACSTMSVRTKARHAERALW